MQIARLVFERAPQALYEEIVHNRPSMDRYTGVLGDSAVLKAGELAALVGVEDLRRPMAAQGLFQRLDARLLKIEMHCIRRQLVGFGLAVEVFEHVGRCLDAGIRARKLEDVAAIAQRHAEAGLDQLQVFVALAALTVVTVAISYLDLGTGFTITSRRGS